MDKLIVEIEKDRYEDYISIQKLLFKNSYTWENGTQTIRKSKLNKATHVLIDNNKKIIKRYLSHQSITYIFTDVQIKTMLSSTYLKE